MKMVAYLEVHNRVVDQEAVNWIGGRSAKTKFPSFNLFSLLYPHTEKNEIKVALKYSIAVTFLSVH